MIPDLNDDGYLPPGIHAATLEEVMQRFGSGSELRRVQFESLAWLIPIAWRAGVERIVINGSFTTDTFEPNDVDCALLMGPNYPSDASADAELQQGLPFIQMELLGKMAFDYLTHTLYAADRDGVAKGVVEIMP